MHSAISLTSIRPLFTMRSAANPSIVRRDTHVADKRPHADPRLLQTRGDFAIDLQVAEGYAPDIVCFIPSGH